ncbi:hypothetical protein [Microbacterium aurum]
MGDPEIDAMSAVATALTDLEEDAQGRVLRWAAERYGVSIATSGRRSGPSAGDQAEEAGDEVTEEEIAEEAPAYEHFAELFAKAQPKLNRIRRWSPRTGYRRFRARVRGSRQRCRRSSRISATRSVTSQMR